MNCVTMWDVTSVEDREFFALKRNLDLTQI